MAINKQVIQDIRKRRAIQELEAALKVSDAVSQQLLQVSGLRDRVKTRQTLKMRPEQRHALLHLAEQIEKEEAMLEAEQAKRQPNRKQV